MRPGRDVKGELARIEPARACCRAAELEGLRFREGRAVRTLDPSTARVALRLSPGSPTPSGAIRATAGSQARHRLAVATPVPRAGSAFRWATAPACDRRAFLRGVILGSGSLSFSPSGPHVEFAFPDLVHARRLRRRLVASGVRAAEYDRRGRRVVYVKGRPDVAQLLRLAGAYGTLLELETEQVGHDVQNRLNRLMNAEAANVDRTVRAAERQVAAVQRLAASGRLDDLPPSLRVVADARRDRPDADLESLAAGLGLGRSAVYHRLRHIEALAAARRPRLRRQTA